MDKNGWLKDASRIMKKVQSRAVSATLATLSSTADSMVEKIGTYWKLRDFGVTGNAFTSVSIGVYYKGKLVYIANNGEHRDPPTRSTLRKGEEYNLPEYYDGDEVSGQPYKGENGRGGQYGPTLGPWYMRRQHFAKRKTWVLLIAMPVSYAEYNPGLVATMQAMHDALPSEVDYNIISVQGAPRSQIYRFNTNNNIHQWSS